MRLLRQNKRRIHMTIFGKTLATLLLLAVITGFFFIMFHDRGKVGKVLMWILALETFVFMTILFVFIWI